MILIADGGSTKTDWVALDKQKKELFRVRTLGLNPAISTKEILQSRLQNNYQLLQYKDKVTEVFFYGAGCGTSVAKNILEGIFKSFFNKAKISVNEDLLAAVYASSGGKEAIVCILGTGSNSCYYDGKNIVSNVISLGYILMDEASANYFGKILLRDYFYHKMPPEIAKSFEDTYDLDPDTVKEHLYQLESPNAYLGKFAQFMFSFKEENYIHNIIEDGFDTFFRYRILPYKQAISTPIYFIGSIAFFFRSILERVAKTYGYTIKDVIRRPIDKLIQYHQQT